MGKSRITTFYAGPASDIEVDLINGKLNVLSCFPKFIHPIISEKYARLIYVIASELFDASIAEGQFLKILKVA